MALSVTHTFVSAVVDENNPGEVGPDEWNATHTISGTLPAANLTAAGNNTEVQFNDSGAFAGDAAFTWNKTTNVLTVDASSALTNTVAVPLVVKHTTSGTPAAGIGVGMQFLQETSADNTEILASIDAVTESVTGGSEVAILVFNVMGAGVAGTTRMEVFGTGDVEFECDTGAGFAVRSSGYSYHYIQSSNDSGPPEFFFNRARGTDSSKTIVQDTDELGLLPFFGWDGDQFVRAARIGVAVDGTPGNNDMPAKLFFGTTPDGSSNPVDRLIIDSAGLTTVVKTTVLTNSVANVLRIQHITDGTPATGIGARMEFMQETSASNNEVIATIDAITTDVSAGSEDALLAFSLMSAGAAASVRARMYPDGVVLGAATEAAGVITPASGATVAKAAVGNHGVLTGSLYAPGDATNDVFLSDNGVFSVNHFFSGNLSGANQAGINCSLGVNIDNNDVNFIRAMQFFLVINGDSVGDVNVETTSILLQPWNAGSGTVANMYELKIEPYNNGTVTTHYGIYITDTFGDGTCTNNIGINIEDQSGVGSSISYNIFSRGASSRNVFEGTVEIGTDVLPLTDDTVDLGSGALRFKDLYLGSVINFGNGDVLVTHTSNNLDVTGGTLSVGGSTVQTAATGQPLDADLTAIAALTTTAAGRSALTIADPGVDRIVAWDDSDGAMEAIALADIATEAAPAAGDFVLIYGAEGDLRKVNWSGLPGAGSGIPEVAADLSPTLGGDLDLGGFDILATSGTVINFDAGDVTITHAANLLTLAGGDLRVSTAGTDSASVVTVGGTQTLTSKTFDLTSNTLVGSVAEFNAALESADFYTTGGTDVALADGGTGASLADPNADRIMFWDDSGGAVTWLEPKAPVSISGTELRVCPKGYIWALTMSNAADTANDITVAAGEATDETGVDVMVLAAPITKRMDASWAVGTDQGGLNTGVEANSTWYEVHLIKRPDTGVVDVMFTTTANRATLPANYTLQRRIGWIRNDGAGALLQFTQIDDHITLTTQINDASITATATAAAITVTVPPNAIGRFRISSDSNTDNAVNQVTVFSEIVEGNVTPTDATGIASIGCHDIAGSQASHMELRVSSSSTIEHDSSHTANVIDVSTFGWIDHRRAMSAT